MTSAQTELLQRFQDAAAAYAAACDLFVHAFGQDHGDIAVSVGTSGMNAGETAHTVAAWAASHGE